MELHRILRRRFRKIFNALREYWHLFIDGEADMEDYVLFVLLLTYGFIWILYVVPTVGGKR